MNIEDLILNKNREVKIRYTNKLQLLACITAVGNMLNIFSHNKIRVRTSNAAVS